MINLFRKCNQTLLLFLNGAAFYFSMLYYSFSIVGMAAVLTGTAYTTLMITVSLFFVLIATLLAKLLSHVAFRIAGAVFTRKSGMLYPFPIHYGDFIKTVLSFSFICLMICGLVSLPILFIPTLSTVLGAVRSLVMWVFLFIGARYMVREFSHDYDKRTLAVSLSVLPFILIGLTLALTVLEVAL